MSDHALPYPLPAAPPRIVGGLRWRQLRRRALALLYLWHRRAKTRRQLARLDARLLADVGLDPEIARREAALPFWRASITETR